MLTIRLLAVCVALCFSSTTTVAGDFEIRTWDQAIAMAKSFVNQLTLQEKCHLTAGVGGVCAGNIPALPRVNFTGFCLLDAPSGPGDGVLYSTASVGGIHIAASWDRDLFYQRAVAIGREFRGKGIHYALGPMMNIDRNARHGRNWEGFGSDPYLSGENSFFYIQGVQDQGVVAKAKHFICNEQDTHRSGANDDIVYSANLDDKTMHEIYLWPFASSVAAGAGSVMCSANEINETRACQNNKTQNGLLKGELGYLGNILTDWMGSKSTIDPVLSGLDIDMPGHDNLMGLALLPGVQNGSISEARITDMVVRILAPYFLLGQDQNFPPLNLSFDATSDHYIVNREVGRAGFILLKNVRNTLPLNSNSDKFFSIYGSAAGRQQDGTHPRGVLGIDGALYQGGG